MQIIRYGPIITPTKIPRDFDSSNIGNCSVFKTPECLKRLYDTEYLMLFSGHLGRGIRVAGSEHPEKNWRVFKRPLLHIDQTLCTDPLLQLDVVWSHDIFGVIYSGVYQGLQTVFISATFDGCDYKHKNLNINQEYYGLRYFSIENNSYIIYTNNNSVIIKKFYDNEFILHSKIDLKNVRSLHLDTNKDPWLYWTVIGDSPESIHRGKLNLVTFTLSNIQTICSPSDMWDGGRLPNLPSKPGPESKVNQLRHPFVFNNRGRKFIYYNYSGETGIAVLEIINA